MVSKRRLLIATGKAFLVGTCVLAAEPLTNDAQTAKNMLVRAAVAVRQNQAQALADFNNGVNGSREGDMYVFCARTDGRVDAHIDPAQIGKNILDLYDVDGVPFGQEMLAIAREGIIKGVSYMYPKPGSFKPVPKVTFVTKVGNQVCGVGYYK